VPAQRDEPVVGLARSHRRLDQDREQRLAVETRREGLAHPAHGLLDLDPLAAKLIHLLAQPVAHLVELVREPGHLVAAAHGNRAGEVALADPPRGGEHVADVALERPQRGRHREQGDREEGEQRDRQGRPRRDEALALDRREQRHPHPLLAERLGRRDAQVVAVLLEVRRVPAFWQIGLVDRNRAGDPGAAPHQSSVLPGHLGDRAEI
jgi:hypothetical protein